jgi:hypothetical protein
MNFKDSLEELFTSHWRLIELLLLLYPIVSVYTLIAHVQKAAVSHNEAEIEGLLKQMDTQETKFNPTY